MANKDLLKQAIAEAKSVREAAIANAKEALEETLTPHLKDLLAAKLQEMEEEEEEVMDETTSGFTAVKEAEEEEAEDESEESEDEAGHEAEESEEEEAAEDEDMEEDEEVGDLSVEEFKDMIRDIIAQELGSAGGGEEEMGADMDAGDIEGMGDEAPAEEPEVDDEEIDINELLREIEESSRLQERRRQTRSSRVVREGKREFKPSRTFAKEDTYSSELNEALQTIESLRKDLQEVNLLNSKLLYVNKIFKANSLTESQKVNIIAAFDKAETVKEVKLVFNTVSESIVTPKQVIRKRVNESVRKPKGMASRATGTTATKPQVINEVSDAVRRMQKLAGIIK